MRHHVRRAPLFVALIWLLCSVLPSTKADPFPVSFCSEANVLGYDVHVKNPTEGSKVSSQTSLKIDGEFTYPVFNGSTPGDFFFVVTGFCEGGEIFQPANVTFSIARPFFETSFTDDAVHSCRGHVFHIYTRLYAQNSQVACSHTSVDVNSDVLSILFLIFSIASALGCSTLIYYYIKYPILRRFPSNLVFWRTVVDLIFALQFIWLNGWAVHTIVGEAACNGSVAFITQFSIMASLDWYMVMAVNFYFSIENPFVRPQSRTKIYHIVSWGWAFVTAVFASFLFGYRDDFHLCWIKKVSTGINYGNWVAYFIWIALFAILCLVILLYGQRKLSQDGGRLFDVTLSKRKETLRQTRIYILVFTFYWMIAAVIWFLVFITSQNYEVIQTESLAYLFSMVVPLLGLVDVATWLYIQRVPLRTARLQAAKERARGTSNAGASTEHLDDISDALRHEFITCTTEGILSALRQGFEPSPQYDSIEIAESPASSEAPQDEFKAPLLKDTSALSPPSSRFAPEGRRPSYRYMDVVATIGSTDEETMRDEVHVLSLAKGQSFRSYAPRLFPKIREICGLSEQEYIRGMDGDVADMKKNFSEGASGSFFFFSKKREFMVKTLTSEEYEVLKSILPHYVRYLRDNPRTLLCQFFGLYSIEMYEHTEYFVVMNNVLDNSNKYEIDERYDLKGSSINRHGVPRNGKISTYKDNDLKKKLNLDQQIAETMCHQLALDANFLRSLDIMDYSLLVGVHNCQEPRNALLLTHCNALSASHFPTRASMLYATPSAIPTVQHSALHLFSSPSLVTANGDAASPYVSAVSADAVQLEALSMSSHSLATLSTIEEQSHRYRESEASSFTVIPASVIVGPGIYHLGIIDMLQKWNWKKKSEQYLKRVFGCHCADYEFLSAVEPESYKERFKAMTRRVLLGEDDSVPLYKTQ